MSYVYVETEAGDGFTMMTVGHYTPDGKFHAESDHRAETRKVATKGAAARVHYLNGGSLHNCQPGTISEAWFTTTETRTTKREGTK